MTANDLEDRSKGANQNHHFDRDCFEKFSDITFMNVSEEGKKQYSHAQGILLDVHSDGFYMKTGDSCLKYSGRIVSADRIKTPYDSN